MNAHSLVVAYVKIANEFIESKIHELNSKRPVEPVRTRSKEHFWKTHLFRMTVFDQKILTSPEPELALESIKLQNSMLLRVFGVYTAFPRIPGPSHLELVKNRQQRPLVSHPKYTPAEIPLEIDVETLFPEYITEL